MHDAELLHTLYIINMTVVVPRKVFFSFIDFVLSDSQLLLFREVFIFSGVSEFLVN
tara:strand:- start:444 stop:611 length:168 start_codon:yes stop_codon:yes gene_type:complete